MLLHFFIIISQIVYGIKVLPKGDPYLSTAEKALAALTFAGIPGSFLVDVLPIRVLYYLTILLLFVFTILYQ